MENVSIILKKYRLILAWGMVAFVFKFFPLINHLHVESCMILAGFAFIASGISVIVNKRFSQLKQHIIGILGAALLLLLPFPCPDWLVSIQLFGLFVVPSFCLGAAIGYRVSHSKFQWKKSIFAVIVLLLLLVPPLFDLGFHPQMYHYNHVFGGVLNPIYDEELALRSGFIVFRGLTILWAIFLGWNAWFSNKKWRWFVLLPILLIYSQMGELGLVTTYRQIEAGLGTRFSTPHFDIWYDANRTRPDFIQQWATEHEAAYRMIEKELGFGIEARIQSYIYPSAARKAELTGARWTNVSPVWLKKPQMHLLNETQSSMQHELAHVFSRKIGLPVLNASRYIGLVEGFAVSLEEPKGVPNPTEQLALLLDPKDYPQFVEHMAQSMSPKGFWSGRGAVSYTTAGAFVRFLRAQYGEKQFAKVYAWGNFEEVYQKSLHRLLWEWMSQLKQERNHLLMLNELWILESRNFTQKRFSVPSLFEQKCPHCIPIEVQKMEQAHEMVSPFTAKPDTLKALQRLKETKGAEFFYAKLLMHTQKFEAAAKVLTATEDGVEQKLLWAEWHYLKGNFPKSEEIYQKVFPQIPYFARKTKAEIRRRRYVMAKGLPIEKVPRTFLCKFEKALQQNDLHMASKIAQSAAQAAEDEPMKRFWTAKISYLKIIAP